MMIKTAALLKGTCDYNTDGKFFLFREAYPKEWSQENCANTSQSKAEWPQQYTHTLHILQCHIMYAWFSLLLSDFSWTFVHSHCQFERFGGKVLYQDCKVIRCSCSVSAFKDISSSWILSVIVFLASWSDTLFDLNWSNMFPKSIGLPKLIVTLLRIRR